MYTVNVTRETYIVLLCDYKYISLIHTTYQIAKLFGESIIILIFTCTYILLLYIHFIKPGRFGFSRGECNENRTLLLRFLICIYARQSCLPLTLRS